MANWTEFEVAFEVGAASPYPSTALSAGVLSYPSAEALDATRQDGEEPRAAPRRAAVRETTARCDRCKGSGEKLRDRVKRPLSKPRRCADCEGNGYVVALTAAPTGCEISSTWTPTPRSELTGLGNLTERIAALPPRLQLLAEVWLGPVGQHARQRFAEFETVALWPMTSPGVALLSHLKLRAKPGAPRHVAPAYWYAQLCQDDVDGWTLALRAHKEASALKAELLAALGVKP